MSRLSHNSKYFGTFTNSKGETRGAFILWDTEKSGYVLRDELTSKVINNTAFATLEAMREAGVNFSLTGKSEPVGEPAAA